MTNFFRFVILIFYINSWKYFIISFGTKRAEKLLLTWKKFSGMPVSDFFFWSDFYIFSIQQNAKSRWRCGSFWMSLFFFANLKMNYVKTYAFPENDISRCSFSKSYEVLKIVQFLVLKVSTNLQILVIILNWFFYQVVDI